MGTEKECLIGNINTNESITGNKVYLGENASMITETQKALKKLEYTMKASAKAMYEFNKAYSKLPIEIKRKIRKRKFKIKYNDTIFKVKQWFKYKLLKAIKPNLINR